MRQSELRRAWRGRDITAQVLVLGVLEELLGDLLRMLDEALVGKVNMKTI